MASLRTQKNHLVFERDDGSTHKHSHTELNVILKQSIVDQGQKVGLVILEQINCLELVEVFKSAGA